MSGSGPDSPLRRTLERIAHAAGRAPSKHNTQPWRFVVSATALDVWPDPARALPETDPHRRELLLACGGAAQAAFVLARAAGLDVAVDVLPGGNGGPAARLRVLGEREVSEQDRELARAVSERRTDRGPLVASGLAVGAPFLLQDAAAAQGAELILLTTDGRRRALARLLLDADHALAGRRFAVEEQTAWSRPAGSAAPDGVPASSTRGPASSYGASLVQRDFSLPGSAALHDRPGADQPLLAVLCTPGDRIDDWVAAGRALLGTLLELTLLGGSASYLDQVVEDPRTRLLLRAELGTQGWPQLVLRVGVGGDVAPTARRPVDDVVFQAR